MPGAEASVFERHPKTTLAAVWLVLLLLLAAAAELALQRLTGLGHPVLYFSHPAYGYRMQPNQETWRFGGAHFKINNHGLRAESDWGRGTAGKILFLGDSVTYGGNHISNHELFSEVAVRGLHGFTSGNAGMPNWGVENVYGLVVDAAFLPASVYVSTFIEHDFYRGLQRGDNMPWIRYRQPLLALQELAEFGWYRYVRNPRETNRRLQASEPAEVRLARAAAKLAAMDAFLRARGYQHFIFISPTRAQVLGEQARDARVHEQLEKRRIAAVYLLDQPVMRAAALEERRAWYQDEVHLTAAGHAVWGKLMHEQLVHHLPAGTMMAGR